MMFREEDCYYVKGEGLSRQEFSSLDTALFFALRMSEASGKELAIYRWMYVTVTDQMKMFLVRKVKPHEFKLNPSYGRQERQQRSNTRPPPRTEPKGPLDPAYAFLGVSSNVTENELRSAFRSKAKDYHPDRPNGSTAKFQQLNTYYEMIKKAKGYT